MTRWALVFLAMSVLLAPLAFSDLGRQFGAEARLLVLASLIAAAVLGFAALRRRAG